MATVHDILQDLEAICPERLAFAFDRVGLQVGELNAPVNRAVVSLDRSLGAIQYAINQSCQLLVSHHPLFFTPVADLTDRSHTAASALVLARNGVAFIAAHTNWDCARGGVNDVLATIFELQRVESFGTKSEPEGYSAGRIGELTGPMPFRQWVAHVDERLNTTSYAWGDPERMVRKVAIVGGAADGDAVAALNAGADAFLTGEVRQHIAVELSEGGLALTASGHYATEHPGAVELKRRLSDRTPEIEWLLYEPPAGFHGRPFHTSCGVENDVP